MAPNQFDHELFTDGACSGNPGPGGWAFLLRNAAGDEVKEDGAENPTTNNRMELLSTIRGLERIPEGESVRVTTDSQYVAKGAIEWLPGWKARGWKRKVGTKLEPVANEDLWRRLDALLAVHPHAMRWVRGHAGHPENEDCDRRAVEAYQNLGSGAAPRASMTAARKSLPAVTHVGYAIGAGGRKRAAAAAGDSVYLLSPSFVLGEALAKPDRAAILQQAAEESTDSMPLAEVKWGSPIDRQEVWAAGVTYKRSKQARMEESEQAANFYDKVYSADRPELFFKSAPHRVVGTGEAIRVRRDSKWTVPEPELTLVLTPNLELVGYTVGNDVSARDIEGENPLYLPQAKTYSQSAALGPTIKLAPELPPLETLTIKLEIERKKKIVFSGETSAAAMNRQPLELVEWLRCDNEFPQGVLLMTGTGIVPPDDFTLQQGDVVHIEIAGVGRLSNPVVQAK